MSVKLIALKPKLFKSKVFELEFIKENSKVAKDIEKDYRKTTAKWKKKPKWFRKVERTSKGYVMFVGTNNLIYRYVDEGTKKHIITPRRRKVLRFIGSGYAGKGRPQKGDYVFTPLVNHPGFKGYKHSENFTKRWGPRYRTRMDRAMKRAAKHSGHGR